MEKFMFELVLWIAAVLVLGLEYVIWKFIYRGFKLTFKKLSLFWRIIVGVVVASINRYFIVQIFGALALLFIFSFS